MPAASILIGLIGAGIQASLTPALHEREADALGLRYLYRRIDLNELRLGPDALPDLLTAAQRLSFTGLNVTYPCKQAVLPLLDDLSAEARAIGAVNTVVLADGRRIGHNTDCLGFAAALERGLPDAARERVVLLGAGGAGAAVAHALLAEGVTTLEIYDPEVARCEALVERLNARLDRERESRREPASRRGTDAGVLRERGGRRAIALRSPPVTLAGVDGLVNATPIGMAKLPGTPLPAALLRAQTWVAEIVYFPIETELLALARAAGCRTLDGSLMAVFQAVHAFELFSGVRPDAQRMAAHFRSML